MVKDIYPDSIGSNPQFLTTYNGHLYFTAFSPTQGEEVFISDGTAAGTYVLKDIASGIAGGLGSQGFSDHPRFRVSGSYLFFLASPTGESWNRHLWRSDGTSAGTIAMGGLSNPVNEWSPWDNAYSSDANGELLYLASGGQTLSFLWASNGTPAGTHEVFTSNGLVAKSNGDLFSFNGEVYFNGHDNSHYGLCVSDGTTAGTSLIYPFADTSGFLNLRYLDEFSGYLYFFVQGLIYGQPPVTRLVQSNGTTMGTEVIDGVTPLSRLTPVGDDLFFYGSDTATGQTALYRFHPLDVGLPTIAQIGSPSIFPNPTTGRLSVSMPRTSDMSLEIRDAIGEIIHKERSNGSCIETDIGFLPTGLYFLTLQTQWGTSTQKIIKE